MRRFRGSMRRDENEPEIIAALEAAGAVVRRLDPPMPDLLISFRGTLDLLEVKFVREGHGHARPMRGKHDDPDPRYRELTPTQVKWWRAWEAAEGKPPALVHDAAEALAVIGATPAGSGNRDDSGAPSPRPDRP